MDRRGFGLSVATAPLALGLKDPIAQVDVCYLRVRQDRAMAMFKGQSFEPKTERHGGEVVIMDDLPSIVHLDMKSLQN